MNEEYKIPNHVAIILDGNGRWAKKRGLKRSLGHKAGFENLKELSNYIFERGVKILSVFAFSTENFKREKEEVDYLMDLFANKFKEYRNEKNNVKLVFSGRREGLPDKVIQAIDEMEEATKNNTEHIFNICVNFGGRADIIDATKKIVRDVELGKLDIDTLDEMKYIKYLYNEIPDIDFFIRTSGEVRVSNFILYQSAYAEMYFPDTLFPDFGKEEFDKALDVYNKRDRRFGDVKRDENGK